MDVPAIMLQGTGQDSMKERYTVLGNHQEYASDAFAVSSEGSTDGKSIRKGELASLATHSSPSNRLP